MARMIAAASSPVVEIDRSVRLRLLVGYDGTEFSGWAVQPGLRTVQATLEGALTTVLRISDACLTVAGRTDAGVHARGQVCHVDVPASAWDLIGAHDLARRLARLLPADVRVSSVDEAPPGFDARFSAIWRRYAYRICDEPSRADPLQRAHVLAWSRKLDVFAMHTAAQRLLGEHDFAAYCRRREGATTIRTLQELSWARDGHLVTARVVADAFCHHLVRSLVGALIAVGEGRRSGEWPAQVLAAGERNSAVLVVPARGLTLEEVGYPADQDLAARAQETRAMRTVRTVRGE